VTKSLIEGSEFADTNLDYSVCSHLQPILELLSLRGNAFDASGPLDKSRGGSTRLVAKPIDFELIERSFEIPTFIELNRTDRAVICRKCWCDIAEQQPDSVS
jgi:hypothetical protein